MGSEIVWYCDNEILHGPEREARPPAVPYAYSLPGLGKPGDLYECELCNPCEESIKVTDLKELLRRVNRQVDKPTKISEAQRPLPGMSVPVVVPGGRRGRKADSYPFVCLDVSCHAAYAGRTGLINHYTNAHGLRAGIAMLPPTLNQCPVCESPVNGPAGLGQHVGKSHPDIPGSGYGAVLQAANGDDEYGVAAEVVAWLRRNGAHIEF